MLLLALGLMILNDKLVVSHRCNHRPFLHFSVLTRTSLRAAVPLLVSGYGEFVSLGGRAHDEERVVDGREEVFVGGGFVLECARGVLEHLAGALGLAGLEEAREHAAIPQEHAALALHAVLHKAPLVVEPVQHGRMRLSGLVEEGGGGGFY